MWPDGWTVVPVAGVSVDISAPPFHAECTWPTKTARDDVTIVVKITDTSVAGGGMLIPRTRINLESSSARQGLERATGLKDDRRDEFARFFKTLADLMGELHRQQQPIHELRIDQDPAPVDWLVYPIWPAYNTAIVAAYGSLKSFSALGAAVTAATGTSILRGHTRNNTPRPIWYLDWEGDRAITESRLRALCSGRGVDPTGQLHYMNLTLPLTDVIHDLTPYAANYGGVVIDSESAAIGGSLLDDAKTNMFWDAVQTLGIPALVIAHKSAQNIRQREARFFGSIMNENRIRMAWNLEVEDASSRVVWSCFKDSYGAKEGTKLAWEWEFVSTGDDEAETLQTTTAQPIDWRNVNLRRANGDDQPRTVADDIEQVLAYEGPMKAAEIAELLNRSEGTIRAVLNRNKDRNTKLADGRWKTVTTSVTDRPNPFPGKA